jgi:hypothetical protein
MRVFYSPIPDSLRSSADACRSLSDAVEGTPPQILRGCSFASDGARRRAEEMQVNGVMAANSFGNVAEFRGFFLRLADIA